MRGLQEHLLLPVADDTNGRRAQLVYADSEHVRMVPYAKSHLHMALYVLMVILSGGLLLIVSVWFPQIFTRLARMRLPYSCLGEADYMLILVQDDGFRSKWVETRVHHQDRISTSKPTNPIVEPATTDLPRTLNKLPWIWLEFKKHRYVFNHDKGEYERFLSTIHEDLEKIQTRLETGLTTYDASTNLGIFGPNVVDIDQPSITMLFFTKIVHPYYLFQVFSSIVWFFQDYILYAIVILVLSAISMTWEVYSEVSNGNRLRAMVQSNVQVAVFRAGAKSSTEALPDASGAQEASQGVVSVLEPAKPVLLHEQQLVPGDIVELTVGPVCADVLLLTGGCVVDEASLTGEAIPINKEPARNHPSVHGKSLITVEEARKEFKSSFLHAGSTITRLRDATGVCKGVVLSTGFSTGKGELFRSIIFPREISFEFERDSYRYLAVLAAVALAAFIKRIVDFGNEGYSFGYTIINSLDLITIAVPPALPLVLSSGIGFALRRLQQQGIFCIESQRINSCGQLTCFCFDKTGTLTEESLTLVGMDVVVGPQLKRMDVVKEAPHYVRTAMAVCHSLSRVNGELQGYPLELGMFEAVNDGLLDGVPVDCGTLNSFKNNTYLVHERFAFDALYQRSSVIAQVPGLDSDVPVSAVFVKGSIEAVQRLCTSVPSDLAVKAQQYASQGHYCIAFGMRLLTTEELHASREVVETNLTFLGLALFQNELKPDSKQVIRELYDAHVDVRMITGDHALTAVHVAQELEMKMEKSQIAVVDVEQSTGDVHYHCVQRRIPTSKPVVIESIAASTSIPSIKLAPPTPLPKRLSPCGVEACICINPKTQSVLPLVELHPPTIEKQGSFDEMGPYVLGMCHSLGRKNGKLVGCPVEIHTAYYACREIGGVLFRTLPINIPVGQMDSYFNGTWNIIKRFPCDSQHPSRYSMLVQSYNEIGSIIESFVFTKDESSSIQSILNVVPIELNNTIANQEQSIRTVYAYKQLTENPTVLKTLSRVDLEKDLEVVAMVSTCIDNQPILHPRKECGFKNCPCRDNMEEAYELEALYEMNGHLEARKTTDDITNSTLQSAFTLHHNLVRNNDVYHGCPMELALIKDGSSLLKGVLSTFITNNMYMEEKECIQRIIPCDKEYPMLSSIILSSTLTDGPVQHRIFSKGSPEAIHKICNSIPDDLYHYMDEEQLTRKGLYCIAYAFESISENHLNNDIPRQELEKDLQFLGFAVFKRPNVHDKTCTYTSCICQSNTVKNMELISLHQVTSGEEESIQIFNHLSDLSLQTPLHQALSICHSLRREYNRICGCDIERTTFDQESTFIKDLPHHLPIINKCGNMGTIIKRFPYDVDFPDHMSVIIENEVVVIDSEEEYLLRKDHTLFVKGSLNVIKEKSLTVPTVLDEYLNADKLARKGIYCVAYAFKTLSSLSNLETREELEKDLTFLGIALVQQKPMVGKYEEDVEVSTIDDVSEQAITTDKVREQAITNVAVEATTPTEIHWERFDASNMSRILAEYDMAITGAALEHLQTEMSDESIKQLVLQTRIYARIRPTQKAWIIEHLSDYGHIVGMCGDGTNDCGALKAAHVGLALSSAEASIVAPFTSKQKAVSDVPALIREGRCALTTSFLGFKFMVLYPIIQLGMASTLGHFNTMLTNNQYMWDDLGIVLGLAISMLYTASSTTLSREKPPHTLFSRTIVLSILGQVALFIAFFAGMFALLNQEEWFCPREDGMTYAAAFMEDPLNITTILKDPAKCEFYSAWATTAFVTESIDDIPVSYEDSTIWLFAHMMYFSVAAAFNLKDKFRQPFYTNKLFTLLFTASLGTNLWFLLDTSNIIGDSFDTLPLPSEFRIRMLIMFIAHFIAALLWEYFATRTVMQWTLALEVKANQELKARKERHEQHHQVTTQVVATNVESPV